MAIQSSVNQMLGTAAGVLTAAEHLSKQNQTNKKLEQNNESLEQNNELKRKELDLQKAELKGTIANNEATLNEQDQYVESELQRRNGYDELVADSTTDDKLKLLEGYAGGDVLNAKKGVELERARIAMETVQGKMEARRQLKFDIEIAKKKLEMLGEQNG